VDGRLAYKNAARIFIDTIVSNNNSYYKYQQRQRVARSQQQQQLNKFSNEDKELLISAVEFISQALTDEIANLGTNTPEILTKKYEKYQILISRLKLGD
jgi:hypothetical protein